MLKYKIISLENGSKVRSNSWENSLLEIPFFNCLNCLIYIYIYIYWYIYKYRIHIYIVLSWRQSNAPILLITWMLVDHSIGSNTNNAWTPPLAVHSEHVATKPLRWWGGWVQWVVFMAALYIYVYIFICIRIYKYINIYAQGMYTYVSYNII